MEAVVEEKFESTHRGELMKSVFMQLQAYRMNEIYYSNRAGLVRARMRAANVVSAVLSSAAVFTLLKDGFGAGGTLLLVLTTAAAVMSAVVPLLGWDSDLAEFTSACRGHAMLKGQAREWLRKAKVSEMTDHLEGNLAQMREVASNVAAWTHDQTDEKILEAAWVQACKEFPSESAWEIL